MTAKQIMEIIENKQKAYQEKAEEYSKRLMDVQAGKHDRLSAENLLMMSDMMEHKVDAMASLKLAIRVEELKVRNVTI